MFYEIDRGHGWITDSAQNTPPLTGSLGILTGATYSTNCVILCKLIQVYAMMSFKLITSPGFGSSSGF